MFLKTPYKHHFLFLIGFNILLTISTIVNVQASAEDGDGRDCVSHPHSPIALSMLSENVDIPISFSKKDPVEQFKALAKGLPPLLGLTSVLEAHGFSPEEGIIIFSLQSLPESRRIKILSCFGFLPPPAVIREDVASRAMPEHNATGSEPLGIIGETKEYLIVTSHLEASTTHNYANTLPAISFGEYTESQLSHLISLLRELRPSEKKPIGYKKLTGFYNTKCPEKPISNWSLRIIIEKINKKELGKKLFLLYGEDIWKIFTGNFLDLCQLAEIKEADFWKKWVKKFPPPVL